MRVDSIGIAAESLLALGAGQRASRVLLAIGFGLCCSAGLLLTAGGKLNQAGSADPVIYAGYIHDFGRLLGRFGHSYYS